MWANEGTARVNLVLDVDSLAANELELFNIDDYRDAVGVTYLDSYYDVFEATLLLMGIMGTISSEDLLREHMKLLTAIRKRHGIPLDAPPENTLPVTPFEEMLYELGLPLPDVYANWLENLEQNSSELIFEN